MGKKKSIKEKNDPSLNEVMTEQKRALLKHGEVNRLIDQITELWNGTLDSWNVASDEFHLSTGDDANVKRHQTELKQLLEDFLYTLDCINQDADQLKINVEQLAEQIDNIKHIVTQTKHDAVHVAPSQSDIAIHNDTHDYGLHLKTDTPTNIREDPPDVNTQSTSGTAQGDTTNLQLKTRDGKDLQDTEADVSLEEMAKFYTDLDQQHKRRGSVSLKGQRRLSTASPRGEATYKNIWKSQHPNNVDLLEHHSSSSGSSWIDIDSRASDHSPHQGGADSPSSFSDNTHDKLLVTGCGCDPSTCPCTTSSDGCQCGVTGPDPCCTMNKNVDTQSISSLKSLDRALSDEQHNNNNKNKAPSAQQKTTVHKKPTKTTTTTTSSSTSRPSSAVPLNQNNARQEQSSHSRPSQEPVQPQSSSSLRQVHPLTQDLTRATIQLDDLHTDLSILTYDAMESIKSWHPTLLENRDRLTGIEDKIPTLSTKMSQSSHGNINLLLTPREERRMDKFIAQYHFFDPETGEPYSFYDVIAFYNTLNERMMSLYELEDDLATITESLDNIIYTSEKPISPALTAFQQLCGKRIRQMRNTINSHRDYYNVRLDELYPFYTTAVLLSQYESQQMSEAQVQRRNYLARSNSRDNNSDHEDQLSWEDERTIQQQNIYDQLPQEYGKFVEPHDQRAFKALLPLIANDWTMLKSIHPSQQQQQQQQRRR